MEYSYDEMKKHIIMWRTALEDGYDVKTVFDSMCVYLGEQQREIDRLKNK